MWALVALLAVLPLCFVPIVMALDTREDDQRTREYEADRDAFYARMRARREAFYEELGRRR